MAQSGWYDDPDGTPGRLRYWDGSQWTPDTMPKPDTTAILPPASEETPDQTAVLPPASTTPDQTAVLPPVQPPYGPQSGQAGGQAYGANAYGQGGAYGSYSTQPGATPYTGTPYGQPPQTPTPRKKRTPPLVIAGVLVMMVAIIVGINALAGRFFGGGTATTSPRPSVTLPSTFPTATRPTVTVPGQAASPTMPTMSPSGPSANCATPAAGTLSDGTIAVTLPSTWQKDSQSTLGWSDCYMIGNRSVATGWVTSAIVADIPEPLDTAQDTAEALWDWNLDANYSSLRITSATITKKESVTVGGLEGYKLTGVVRVSGLSGVPGDDVQILVLPDVGDIHHTVFTVSTIDDATSKAEVAAIWSSIKLV